MHGLCRIWCGPQHLGTQCVPPCIIIAVIFRQIFDIDSSWVFFRNCGGYSGHSSKISQNLLGLITLCGFPLLIRFVYKRKQTNNTATASLSFSPSLVLSLSHKFVKRSLIIQVPLETCHVEICTLSNVTETCHHSSIGSDAVLTWFGSCKVETINRVGKLLDPWKTASSSTLQLACDNRVFFAHVCFFSP